MGIFGVWLGFAPPTNEEKGLVALLLLMGCFGIYVLGAFGVDVVCSAVAARRFDKHFGFTPPETREGKEALRKAVDRVLTKKAVDLDAVYREEERIVSAISEVGEICVVPESAGREVETLERDLREYAKKKKVAKSNFYAARDAAESHCLPKPFGVYPSYKDYLKGDYLKREVAA